MHMYAYIWVSMCVWSAVEKVGEYGQYDQWGLVLQDFIKLHSTQRTIHKPGWKSKFPHLSSIQMSHEKKLITFHYTGCLIRILTMAYYNPSIIGYYNPLYNLNNQGFFIAQMFQAATHICQFYHWNFSGFLYIIFLSRCRSNFQSLNRRNKTQSRRISLNLLSTQKKNRHTLRCFFWPFAWEGRKAACPPPPKKKSIITLNILEDHNFQPISPPCPKLNIIGHHPRCKSQPLV